MCINGTSVGVLRTNCRHCDKENYYALGFLSEFNSSPGCLLTEPTPHTLIAPIILYDGCQKWTLCVFFCPSAVIGDIILVALVLIAAMKFKLSFPHSLKGLLFYLQTSYHVTEYFPISFWDIRQYVSELSSDLCELKL